jgi:hypothetical protein
VNLGVGGGPYARHSTAKEADVLKEKVQAWSKYQWWQWAKLIAPLTVPVLLTGNPMLVGMVFHLLCDFTWQSGWTAMEKAKGNKRALVVHALCAGALPFALAGTLAYGPIGTLVGAVVGFGTHLWIDTQNKWGIKQWQYAISADQGAHLSALALIVVLLQAL